MWRLLVIPLSKIELAPVLTNDSICDVSKYSQQNVTKTLNFMGRRAEKVNITFLGNFDQFFGIAVVIRYLCSY